MPDPTQKINMAMDRDKDEEPVLLVSDPAKPLVALAFKLQESRFGQLTYMRLYQGTLRKGDVFMNVDTKVGNPYAELYLDSTCVVRIPHLVFPYVLGQAKIKVPRLVRMHSNTMEDIESAGAGEILATFGVECATGQTFTDGRVNYGMSSMYVPQPVISYAIKPSDQKRLANFGKALNRFTKEDPTFRTHVDPESNQTIISGMGELHLEI